MHELSIAQNLVEIATEHLSGAGDVPVIAIRLRVGALSCVHRDALEFSYELVTAETPLAGSRLIVEEIPVTIHCPTCNCVKELPGIQSFRCPDCDMPSADIRSGKELELESIELGERCSGEIS